MKFLILFFCCVVGVGIWYLATTRPGPLQGIVQEHGLEVLASRARPKLLFRPQPAMRLEQYGYKTVRPEDRRLQAEGVRVSFAVYRDTRGQLVTALAESPGEWTWIAAHHSPYPVLRQVEEPYGDRDRQETLYESLYVLDADHYPFPDPRAREKILVYRAKFLLFFRKMQVLFEYHEPLALDHARTIDLDPVFLRDFAARARASCQVLFPSKEAYTEVMASMRPLAAAEGIQRKPLARWLGELKHPGANR